MKTLIDKLFERLGYVPKWYHTSLTKRLAIESEIRKCGVRYKVEHVCYGYEIYATTLKGKLLIKFIPYSMLDADNQSYARICAEELCEMLNDKL